MLLNNKEFLFIVFWFYLFKEYKVFLYEIIYCTIERIIRNKYFF